MTRLSEIADLSPADLMEFADEHGVQNVSSKTKETLLYETANRLISQGHELTDRGAVMDAQENKFSFLRSPAANFLSSPRDLFVPHQIMQQYNLRKGDMVEGVLKTPGKKGDRFGIKSVVSINGLSPAKTRFRPNFEDLKVVYPHTRLVMETDDSSNLSMRALDLIAPVGKGGRILVVSPPKAGKTTILQNITHSINKNHPEIKIIVLLIDERPEEINLFSSEIKTEAEIFSSSFDQSSKTHIQVAAMTLEYAKRMVEQGEDVVLLLDSLTRLTRATNAETRSTGKTLSGGIEAGAIEFPKKYFGAARQTEEAGSFTIICTALIDTNSRLDELVHEEFRGRGTSDLVLNKKLAEKRVFPAYDIQKSATRREELLVDPADLQKTNVMRKVLAGMPPEEAMEFLLDKMQGTKSNAEFFASMNA